MPLLNFRPEGAKDFTKASTEEWLGALIHAVGTRPVDPAPGLTVYPQEKPSPKLRVMYAGGAITHSPMKWLTYVLQHLTPAERATAVEESQKGRVMRTAGAAVALVGKTGWDKRAIPVRLHAGDLPVAAMLEEWIGAVLQALPSDVRERAFRAVRKVDATTPGHYRLHAEMPASFGGN